MYDEFGTAYGKWPVVAGTLDETSIIYSFGVGDDISFDLGTIEKVGCNVFAFDPTPKSRLWIEAQKLPEKFHFHPLGLSHEDGEAEFFPPANPDHVSYSQAPGRDQARKPERAAVHRLSTLMQMLDHANIDVVKMDIEGFEYKVLENMLAENILPCQLLVEFHHGMYGIANDQTIRTVDHLRAAGYQLFYVSDGGHEYGFLHV
jgi:FkbM family methyltransferase